MFYRLFILISTLLFAYWGYSLSWSRPITSYRDNKGDIHYSNRNTMPHTCRKNIPYRNIINRYSRAQGIDPCLVICIIQVESGFRPRAVSRSGAMGLMQLMDGTARLYNVKDPLDPGENIRAGTAHLAWLKKKFKGQVPLMLAAYHAGAGRVKQTMSIPPIKSTISYVNRVMKLYGKESNYSHQVKKLYRRIDQEGDIIIYSR